MRMIKYMFHAYKPLGFNLLRGWSSFSITSSVNSSTNKIMVHPPWDQLPIHIWSLIFERLDLEDRIRFNVVCKQWGTLTKHTPQHLWLMLPYESNHQHLSFFDMYEGKVRKLNLPESARGGWLYGCSKGWLFLAIGTDIHNLQMFLFDPISRAQISLPPLSTISKLPNFENRFTFKRSEWNPAARIIYGVEVSSSDASQCVIAVIFSSNNKIMALCRPQDERWTIVEGLLADGYYYGSFLFCDGELYACLIHVDDDNNNNQVPPLQTHSITLGRQSVNLKLICSTTLPPINLFHAVDANESIWYHKDSCQWPYMVESNGQLLTVTQICDSINTWDEDDDVEALLRYYQADTFQVSKIRTTTNDDTLCTTRLTDLGNQSLFLGPGGCFVAENPNKFDKNCIYFLQFFDYSHSTEYPLVCREAGVYYLDGRSSKRCFPSIKTDNQGLFMHWFSPNIKSGVSA